MGPGRVTTPQSLQSLELAPDEIRLSYSLKPKQVASLPVPQFPLQPVGVPFPELDGKMSQTCGCSVNLI